VTIIVTPGPSKLDNVSWLLYVKREQVTSITVELHWLFIKQRLESKPPDIHIMVAHKSRYGYSFEYVLNGKATCGVLCKCGRAS